MGGMKGPSSTCGAGLRREWVTRWNAWTGPGLQPPDGVALLCTQVFLALKRRQGPGQGVRKLEFWFWAGP